jgi:two-component system sensor histidine kinase MprB
VTLRGRISGVAGLAVAIAVLGAAVAVYFAVRSELRGEIDDALTARAADFRREADEPLGEPGGPPPGRPPPRGRLAPGPPPFGRTRPRPRFGEATAYVQLVRASGRIERPPDETSSLPVSNRTRSLARRGQGQFFADTHVNGTHLRVLTAAVGALGAVQVARPLDEVDRELRRILLILAIVSAAGVALAAALGGLVARAALAPITRFTSRTEALTADPDPSQRMYAEGKDELARLARSFNASLDALERSVEAQRHLVADAGHELRTPMASLRANIQILEDAERLPAEELRQLRADIIGELDELTALVADIVELARGAGAEEDVDDVRLDEVVAAAVERAKRRAPDGVQIDFAGEPTLVRANPGRASRAVSNLLDNALKWSPPAGTVEVALFDGTLSVRDHGPGFGDKDLPYVFERFFRADHARGKPGSGLGLAIVKQAAEANDGWVEATNAPGGGALLRVSFGPVRPIGEDS